MKKYMVIVRVEKEDFLAEIKAEQRAASPDRSRQENPGSMTINREGRLCPPTKKGATQ